MVLVEKIDRQKRRCVVDALESDIIKHVFAFYDIQYEPEHTTMYAAFMDGRLAGYIVVYKALQFPSVVLECEREIVERLIDYSARSRFIMHASPSLLPSLKRKFPDAKYFVESWMLVKRGEARFFKSENVRKMHKEGDAPRLANLLSTRKDRRMMDLEKYTELTSKQHIHGVFINDEIVSYAGSFIQLPEVWMIGGVYTDPRHINKGYATLAASAVTKEALENSEAAALFVRSDNHSAVRVYEEIGYKKIGEKLWIDVGTGMKP